MKEDIEIIEDRSLSAKIRAKPLGAVATRLNIYATITKMLCEVTDEISAFELQALMLARKDINKKNLAGHNALYIAARNGHVDSVNLLMEYNSDITIGDVTSQHSCLHAAAEGGNIKMIERLLECRADPKAIDKDKRTVLHIAAVRCLGGVVHIPTIKCSEIIDAQDIKGSTPLHEACIHQNEDFAQELIASGANFRLRDRNDKTPMAVATSDTLKKTSQGPWL